jgi:hypothetical protein
MSKTTKEKRISQTSRNMEGVRWERDADSEQVLKDAIVIARKVVQSDVQTRLKRAVLNTLIWNVTVSDGKYDTQYYSRAALKEGASRIHEHVFQRAFLVESVLKNQDRLSDYFKLAVSCVVTIEEDTSLNQKGGKLTGWARYRAAGIVVIDRKTRELADLDELQKSAMAVFVSREGTLIKVAKS